MACVTAHHMKMYSVCWKRAPKQKAKSATPMIANRSTRMWPFGVNGRFRKGTIKSCTKIPLQEWRCVESPPKIPSSRTEAKTPSTPTGSKWFKATGTRICDWVCESAIESIVAWAPADAAAKSGCCRKVKAHTASRAMTALFPESRQRPSKPPITAV